MVLLTSDNVARGTVSWEKEESLNRKLFCGNSAGQCILRKGGTIVNKMAAKAID